MLCSDSLRAAIRPCKFCNWQGDSSSRCKVESICFKVNKDYSAILGLYKYAIKK